MGTLNNCASSKTPWGTYLSGEENFAFYFGAGDKPTQDQLRWGAPKSGFYAWDKHDPRFDLQKNPNEFHRFGWVVELDPMDPTSTPVKRTALGRAAHEGAWVGVTKDGSGYPMAVQLAARLVADFPQQCVWGLDWPHPNHTHIPDDGELVNALSKIAPNAEALHQLLVTNPQALYRFET